MSEFKDHFSKNATQYAQYRPTYPKALFEYLANLCPQRHLAWDAATGNGQTALSLTEHFEQVYATDASAEQIASATRHPKIFYKVMPSEHTDFADASFDLVTTSAALHWFDFKTFYPELKRVLKPGGVFAAWCYNLSKVTPAIDTLIENLYATLKPAWPKERAYVDANYTTISFPLREMTAPSFTLQMQWSFDEYSGYIKTWSGLQVHLKIHGESSLDDFWQKLKAAWEDAQQKRTVTWQLPLRIGIV